jgi:predicted dehydrogenase
VTDTVRVGVIGCGWWATYAHLPALQRNDSAAIVGLADSNRQNRAAAAQAFGVSAGFESAEQLLDETEPDAVVVAVPPAFHYECARAALSRGVHVLLEKPMVQDPDHCHELIALARQHEVELVISYPWHYNRQLLDLRDHLANGVIGEIEHVTCLFASIVRELYRGNPEPYRDVLHYVVNAPTASTYSDPAIAGGGQGHNQLTHAVALLMWLTGLIPETVAAFTEAFELRVDLADAVAVRFHGGAIGALSTIGSVYADQEELLEYRIFGKSGHILLDAVQGDVRIYTGGKRRDLPAPEADERYPHWAPVDNLVQLALGHGINQAPGELGLATVLFLNAMYRSSASGGSPIPVPRA